MKLVDVATAVARGATGDGGEATDAQLVRRCLGGDEQAWAALVGRYKRLIYSIPFSYGATADDAGDIFQAVCVDLVTELPKLRKPDALKAWLVSITRHKSTKWKMRMRREQGWDTPDDIMDAVPAGDPDAARLLEDVQRDQGVRAAIAALPDRCQALMRLLFYEPAPVPYADVARRLGVATGSIGFIRGRCLKKLEAALKAQGY